VTIAFIAKLEKENEQLWRVAKLAHELLKLNEKLWETSEGQDQASRVAKCLSEAIDDAIDAKGNGS
jgi:hypothetical protein